MQRERQQEQAEHEVSMEENAGPLLISKLEVNLDKTRIFIQAEGLIHDILINHRSWCFLFLLLKDQFKVASDAYTYICVWIYFHTVFNSIIKIISSTALSFLFSQKLAFDTSHGPSATCFKVTVFPIP